jgi:hypothetical protein
MSTTFGGLDCPIEVDLEAAKTAGARAAAAADFKKSLLLILSSGNALAPSLC